MTGKLTCPRCGKTYLGTTATGRNRTYRYYTCFTRNRYGTPHCDAPRIEADTFDDIVLHAVGDFYRNGTPYIAEAIAAAQHEYETSKAVVESELTAVTSHISQVEASVDRYFSDYETGKIEKGLLERRIDKLGEDLQTLRRRRDELRLRLDDVPVPLAAADLAALQRHIDSIIDHGTSQERKSLCEAAIDKMEIDLQASKAVPTFRCNLTPPPEPANTKSALTKPWPGRITAARMVFASVYLGWTQCGRIRTAFQQLRDLL